MNNLNWRLGLDLGTNSIGWSVFSLDKDNEVLELVDLGVRIFSDGRDSKTNEPLAVSRRIARGQRKSIYRRKLRRKQTFRLLQKQGLFPKDKNDCMKLKDLNPYELRIKALDEKLTPFELGRVLFNLSVRRGFKSNRKDGTREEISEKKNDSEIKSQSDMQTHLEKAIQENHDKDLKLEIAQEEIEQLKAKLAKMENSNKHLTMQLGQQNYQKRVGTLKEKKKKR